MAKMVNFMLGVFIILHNKKERRQKDDMTMR